MKQFDKLTNYPPELRGRLNSFIVTEFDDSMTVEMQLRVLIKWIMKNIDLTNEMVDYLNKFIETFDENLYKTVFDILNAWVKDGMLTEIVNDVFSEQNKKIDDFIAVTKDEQNRKMDKEGVGQLKWANVSQEVRDKISGEGSSGVTADSVIGFEHVVHDSIVNSLIKDNTIEPNKTNFIKTDSNLYNINAISKGGYVHYVSGVWIPDTRFDTSNYIFAEPTKSLTIKKARYLTYYDNNKTFVKGEVVGGGSDIEHTLIMPDKCYYVRIGIQAIHSNTQQVNIGNKLLPYDTFKLYIDNLAYDINSLTDLKDNSIIPEKTTFIKVGKNKLNLYTAIKGYYVNPTTGVLTENSVYISSQPIQLISDISLQNIKFYAVYDVNGSFLYGETLNGKKTILKEKGGSYIRVSPISNLEGVAQVEYGLEFSEIEPYTAILEGIETPSSFKEKPQLNATKNIYITDTDTLNIFKQNTLRENYTKYNFRWGRGVQGEKKYSELFTETGAKNINIELFENDNLLSSKTITVNSVKLRSDKIIALLIGDSTVDSLTTEPPSQARLGYHMLQKMGDKLELIGTRGLGNSKHEGRGGWTAKDYRSNKTDVTGTNPFYNPETKDFDFSYYMTKTKQVKPKTVFIQLGINDVFNYSNNELVNNKINEFISDITFIKDNIKTYGSDIEVIYNLPIPPTEKIDVFAETYKNYNLPQWRYKYNNFMLVNKMIEVFSNDETIKLLNTHLAINVYDNIRDGVHPTDNGYKEIATILCGYLNYV